jgi:succinate dehydrogenase / fumarate reductase cytochrome b subunit
MTTGERPLSPHLQIYRWQITMVLSILHRATGIALAAGALLLAWWLIALAAGPEPYAAVQEFNGSWFGRLLLFGWTWSLFYHLCNGIRHLFWDAGRGFEIPTFTASGWTVVVVSAALTILAWIWGYATLGAP